MQTVQVRSHTRSKNGKNNYLLYTMATEKRKVQSMDSFLHVGKFYDLNNGEFVENKSYKAWTHQEPEPKKTNQIQKTTKIQKDVIQAIQDGNNVIYNAAPGSGKSTICILYKKVESKKSCLYLTFNKKNKEKMKSEDLEFLDVHTFHSFINTYDENRKGKFSNFDTFKYTKKKPSYQVLFVDEAQDLTEDYFKLIWYIGAINTKPLQLILLGDPKQMIYNFQGVEGDERFFLYYGSLFKGFNNLEWKLFTSNESHRLPENICLFLNESILPTMKRENDSLKLIQHINQISKEKVDYKIAYVYTDPGNDIFHYLYDLKVQPRDILILSSVIMFTQPGQTPFQKLFNILVSAGIPVKKDTDDEKSENTILMTSFHACRGLERKYVFVLGFDDYFFTSFPDFQKGKCPNPIYVALTRASHKLTIYQNRYKKPLFDISESDYVEKKGKEEISDEKTDSKPKPIEVIGFVEKNNIEASSIISYKTREIGKSLHVGPKLKPFFSTFILRYYELKQTGSLPSFKMIQNLLEKNPSLEEKCLAVEFENFLEPNFEKIYQNKQINLEELLYYVIYEASVREKSIYSLKNYNDEKDVFQSELESSKKVIEQVATFLKDKVGLSKDSKYEVQVDKDYKEFSMFGRIDCIDQKTIYEFKFINQVTDKDFVQLFLYGNMHKENDHKLCLVNLQNFEIFDCTALTKGESIILSCFESRKKLLSTEDFIKEKMESKNEYLEQRKEKMESKNEYLEQMESKDEYLEQRKEKSESPTKKKKTE